MVPDVAAVMKSLKKRACVGVVSGSNLPKLVEQLGGPHATLEGIARSFVRFLTLPWFARSFISPYIRKIRRRPENERIFMNHDPLSRILELTRGYYAMA
jgi:hypothetical protein